MSREEIYEALLLAAVLVPVFVISTLGYLIEISGGAGEVYRYMAVSYSANTEVGLERVTNVEVADLIGELLTEEE